MGTSSNGGDDEAAVVGRWALIASISLGDSVACVVGHGGQAYCGGERGQAVLFVVHEVSACWLKVEIRQLWAGLRRAPEASVSFQAAQAALWGA